jgi:hypothetical protein
VESRRIRVVAVAAAVLGVAVGGAVGARALLDNDGSSAPPEYEPPSQSGPSYIARISEHPEPSTSQGLWPPSNEWSVSDGTTATTVLAGRDAVHISDGMFRIDRYRFRPGKRPETEVNFVPVVGAGKVTITDAPLGGDVQTWAQERGKIRFESKAGVVGTLDLSTDTVQIEGSR